MYIMRQTLLVLAIALSLVLAGCSGPAGSDTETESEGPTSTPSGTPADSETAGDSPSEPVENPRAAFSWLSDSGVNETSLVLAHATTVNNESAYATQATQRIAGLDSDNESVTQYDLLASASQQRSLYTLNTTFTTSSGTRTDVRTRYREVADGSQTIYQRSAVDGNVSYRVEANPSRNFSTFYQQSTGFDLTFALARFELQYDEAVQRDGVTLYRHTGDSFKPDARVQGGATNASVTVLADDRGIIRSMRFSYESTRNGAPVRLVYTFETTAVGEATLDRPDWLDDAQSS